MSTNSKKQKGYSSLHLAAQNHDNIVENIVSDTSLCLASRLKQRSHESSGFYLGYLRGRSIPPPQKKYCYHYSIQVTISEKSSRRDEVSAHEVSILCLHNRVSKCIECTRLHLGAYSSQKISGTPQEARGIRPLGTSPPNDKS